ncbi:MAG: MurR/RpiR family transcriptional regulator [Schleiferilactobacillus perolens]|jgi:DNA-binding MurR/RpiR family transcriptional regulator|uniref:MurR/RpiR family transcriptional regulator n=1 Tax=Schleiferilactobacillus perolens TaxID=100468 RepID=UPI0039EBDB0A
MDSTQLIRAKYDELTKSEKRVADFVLSAGEKIMYSTMSDLKAATKVGDATIIRFCQKLGYSGFSDFKIAVAKENFSKTELHEESTLYDDMANHLSDALRATAKLIKKDNLRTAVKLMTDAKSIYLFGVGSSGEASLAFESILLRAGVRAVAVPDPHFQAQIASLLTADDLVFGFSLSGRTKDTYDSLHIAQTNGAKIVAITNNPLTPIGKLGDVVLQTAIEEFLNGGSVAGRVSQLYICDVLTHEYEITNHIDAVSLREKVLRAIIDKSID